MLEGRWNMKFLLVNLDWPGLVSKKTYKIHLSLPPLDLLLMSNFVNEKGDEAIIFDGFVEDPSRLQGLLTWADWIVVATTPYHMWQCPNSEWNWITKALEQFPKEKVILSGLHASIFPEQSLKSTGVHAVIRREPEGVLRDFLAKRRWEDTQGVSFLREGQLVENPLGALPLMDELVVKNYNVDISRYGYLLLGDKTGVFEASRGCPWKCTFCDQEMYSWKYRTKTPQVFAQEVSNGIEQSGMKNAYFYDLEFTVSKKRTLELCEELIKQKVQDKLRWTCQTRADTVNEEVVEAMKAAGCVLIHFGVESANPEALRGTNKKIDLESIDKGVRLVKKLGLQTACFFMFGLPGEKPDEFDNTLEFARNLNPTYASFHFAIPFPGTPLYDQYIQEKKLPWGVWPATFFEGWPHEQIVHYLSRAYKKFYLWPKKIEPRQFLFRLQNLPRKLSYFSSVV